MRTTNILPTPRSLSLALPLAFGAIILLAACTGSGDSPSDAGSTPTPQATQTPTVAETPEATAEPTGAAAEPSGDATEPCSLLSEDEVEAAVGNSVVQDLPRVAFCNWKADPDGINVLLSLLSDPQCTSFRPASSEDVSGLGVGAWWEYDEATDSGDLQACPEGWVVILAVDGGTSGAGEATLRAAAEELIAKVLERL